MMAPDRGERLLDRASFGPRPGDRGAIVQEGPEAWLERQLQPGQIPDPEVSERLERFPTRLLSPGDLARGPEMSDLPIARGARNPRAAEPPERARQRMRRLREVGRQMAGVRVVRAVYGRRELQEVMVDFWANHFSVFALKGPLGAMLPHYERVVLRPHALGRFEDLLVAAARSPAMLFYLDNWLSSAEGSRGRGRRRSAGINENYARELLELHTVGVTGGYSQRDVVEVARTFTGWTLRSRRDPGFVFRGRLHDPGPKRVLGEAVRGDGIDEGEGLLRRLARHPATARHISQKLARRFVSDRPPEGLVSRLSEVFLEREGEIREVLRVLLLSPEFVAPEHRKLKTPLEFMASAVRVTAGETDGGRGVLSALRRLGEVPFLARTPAGYPDSVQHWIDPGAMLERIEVALALGAGRVSGTRLGAVYPTGVRTVAPELPLERRSALTLASAEFQWQ